MVSDMERWSAIWMMGTDLGSAAYHLAYIGDVDEGDSSLQRKEHT